MSKKNKKTRNQYPSAPSGPKARQEWVRKRNAAIQHVDEREYMRAIADQQNRRRDYVKDEKGLKP